MAVHEIARRLIGGVWRTVDVEEDGGGNGGSLPDSWTDGGDGDVVATVTDTTKTALTIEAIDGQTEQVFVVKDHLGNSLVQIDPNGTLILQDAAGNNLFVFNVVNGTFGAYGPGGQSVGFTGIGGITVEPHDAGTDALDINGAALDPAEGAAMIVLRNPIGNMPDNFYPTNAITINADLTASDPKLLIKAKDTNGDVVTAEIPLT